MSGIEPVLARASQKSLRIVELIRPLALLLSLVVGSITCAWAAQTPHQDAAAMTFSELGNDVLETMRQSWYVPGKGWRGCASDCGATDQDWGADSLTSVIYERWLVTRDAALVAWLRALIGPASDHRLDVAMWSDVPFWDAVAALREYDATRDAEALRHAVDDYAYVAGRPSFSGGACAGIDYQYPQSPGAPEPAGGGLKTLESDANRVLAAALLAQRVADPQQRARYLEDARRTYAAIRKRFLDPRRALYTVYAFDTGRACTVLPGRFFASVNGVMIEAGLELARATGEEGYMRDARASAHALPQLADDRGVFTDLQAENDIVEPLVLAMLELAQSGDADARRWIIVNAAAAAHARSTDGSYGRFFDGPAPPDERVSIFQTNGGFALMVAAAALEPAMRVEQADPWYDAAVREIRIAAPGSYTFNGSGIALIGALGERCAPAFAGDRLCEGGHVHVLIDGREMVDQTGIWQGKMFAEHIRNALLFAWRWPKRGTHVLTFPLGERNSKEGASFLDVRRAMILQ